MDDAFLAARPSVTIPSTRAMFSSSAGSIRRVSAAGNDVRCTDSGASLSTVRTMF